MKKSYILLSLSMIAMLSVFVFVSKNLEQEKTIVLTEVKTKHQEFVKNSPFKDRLSLSKQERKDIGIPPNKYLEREWELTMNPNLGRPTPENIQEIQKSLAEARALGRVPGDAMDNLWVERGPNNVGGRTRAVMFDPNDATGETVFAGGVSGGLWKNSDITSSATVWSKVNLPANVNVSCIIADPITSTTFYLGTGESYTSDVSGNGIWKSTDSGANWTQIFGGVSGATTFVAASEITVNTPAGIAGNYACFPSTAFGSEITSTITADFILANDGIAPNEDGCTASTVSMTGKIAVIRRGACTFVSKVKAAQNAGAVGVIMMNNVNGTPVAMGGTDATITIPSVMISNVDGDLLEAALNSGTVNGSLNPATGDFTGNLVPGIQHINDIVIRDNGGVSEIYVAAADGFYGAANATTYLGGPEFGLYKSSDGGSNWAELNLPLTAGGNKHCPNDLAIGADNKVWVSTKNSVLYADGGGTIFSSNNASATSFTLKQTIANARRTQIAVSATDAQKVYVLAQGNDTEPIKMIKTTNGFTSTSGMTQPNDDDTATRMVNDFTGGQAYYDLVIAVDPTNDDNLFVGGINLFKSANGGNSWSQFSHWFGGWSHQEVHADQHAITFGPGNKMLFGNDGGVYYSGNSGTTTNVRNNGYNVTQFYSMGVAPSSTGDNFAAGAQDNGTQGFFNANAGMNGSTESQGGDGGSTDYDQDTGNYYISNYVYNTNINQRNLDGSLKKQLSNEPFGTTTNRGDFINQQDLDSNLNILYTNYTDRNNDPIIYQIRRYKIPFFGIVNKFNMTDPLLTGTPVALKVSPYTTGSTKLLVGTVFGDLLQVNNADGNSSVWSDIGDPSFVGSISDIEYGATENEIFVTMHNYGVENIWYTNNGGASWSTKEGNLPDMPVKCILQNPLDADQVIIGTELGVWYTGDFSSTNPSWSSAFNGMSNVKVTDLDLRDDNKVFAATYGRGIFSGDFTAAPLNVDENEFDQLSMYPNPTDGFVNIKSANNLVKATITIHDLSGRLINTHNKTNVTPNHVRLDVSKLATGSYLVTIEEGVYKSTKQIIKK